VANFRRERWQGPDGDVMTAPLPAPRPSWTINSNAEYP